MIVDSHTHVIAHDEAAYPLASKERGEHTIWYLDHGATVDDLLAVMDGASVDTVALVHAFGSHRFDARTVIDSAREHPDRTVGIGGVDVTAPDAAATVRALLADGSAGVRIVIHDGTELAQPQAAGVARAVAEAGEPLLVMSLPNNFAAIERFVASVPDTAIVLDHCSGPDLSSGPPWIGAEPLFRLAQFPNVHLKVSPMVFDTAPAGTSTDLTEQLVARFGADRVMWGSNYPNTFDRSYAGLVDQAREATSTLSDQARDFVLGGTAIRLWPSLAGG